MRKSPAAGHGTRYVPSRRRRLHLSDHARYQRPSGSVCACGGQAPPAAGVELIWDPLA
ncbi:hypothetical protein AB1K54_14445 [Microbacterium sp. BWT-B31]|uniref:hypothetical protein n=1 Tax=Microbacterium sp. BWT-B31 TaxID=3232072 RepID=UPI003528D76D